MKKVNSSAIVIAGAAILAVALAIPLTWLLEGGATLNGGGGMVNSAGTAETTSNPANRPATSGR